MFESASVERRAIFNWNAFRVYYFVFCFWKSLTSKDSVSKPCFIASICSDFLMGSIVLIWKLFPVFERYFNVPRPRHFLFQGLDSEKEEILAVWWSSAFIFQIWDSLLVPSLHFLTASKRWLRPQEEDQAMPHPCTSFFACFKHCLLPTGGIPLLPTAVQNESTFPYWSRTESQLLWSERAPGSCIGSFIFWKGQSASVCIGRRTIYWWWWRNTLLNFGSSLIPCPPCFSTSK